MGLAIESLSEESESMSQENHRLMGANILDQKYADDIEGDGRCTGDACAC